MTLKLPLEICRSEDMTLAIYTADECLIVEVHHDDPKIAKHRAELIVAALEADAEKEEKGDE